MSGQVARRRNYGTFTPGTALNAVNTAKVVSNAGKQLGNQLAKYIKGKQKAKRNNQDAKYAKVVEGHGDITFSKFRSINKPKSSMTKKLASVRGKLIRRYVNTFHISGTAGRQRVDSCIYFETSHLAKMLSDVSASLGALELGGNTPTNATNLEPFISKTNHCLTLTSFVNASQTVTLYDVLCKRDTNEHPGLSWSTGLFLQEDNTSTANSFPVGITPYQSKNFREKWKIEKVTKLQLRPGETHKHYVTVNPNKSVSNARISGINSEAVETYLAGVTRAVMVVIEGTLGRGTASGTVTTTAPSLGMMWQRSYAFHHNTRNVIRQFPIPAAEDLVTTLGDIKIAQPDGDIVPATIVT